MEGRKRSLRRRSTNHGAAAVAPAGLLPGEQFHLIHVTDGTLALTVDGATHLVSAGGSAIALTDRPHAYANPGKEPLRFTMTVHEPAAE